MQPERNAIGFPIRPGESKSLKRWTDLGRIGHAAASNARGLQIFQSKFTGLQQSVQMFLDFLIARGKASQLLAKLIDLSIDLKNGWITAHSMETLSGVFLSSNPY